MNNDNTNTNTNDRIQALANFLELDKEDIKDIEKLDYDDNLYSFYNEEYLVLTYEEAREKTEEYIKNSLCYFNTEFIYLHSVFYGNDNDCTDVIKAIQDKEDNSLIEDIIEDIDSFIEDAIISDGMGHFLATYDNEENSQGDYLIYRIN